MLLVCMYTYIHAHITNMHEHTHRGIVPSTPEINFGYALSHDSCQSLSVSKLNICIGLRKKKNFFLNRLWTHYGRCLACIDVNDLCL